MMDFVLKMMDFVLEMMNCTLKMMKKRLDALEAERKELLHLEARALMFPK